jgi:hypothetical protein
MFRKALLESCLESAKALGPDLKKISWLMSNQPRRDHEVEEAKAA